jgi:hypothetical protein
MALKTFPKRPVDEIPSIQLVLELIAFLDLNKSDEAAALMLKRLHEVSKLLKKDITLGIQEAEKSIVQAVKTEKAPTITLKTAKDALQKSIDMVESAFVKIGQQAIVTKVETQHTGVDAISHALLEEARGLKTNKLDGVLGFLRDDAESYRVIEKRVTEGGHPLFDADFVKTARWCWVQVDLAFDVLASIQKAKGIDFDQLWTSKPTIKTPLRPVLLAKEPAAVPPKAKKGTTKPSKTEKAKADKAKADKKAKKGANSAAENTDSDGNDSESTGSDAENTPSKAEDTASKAKKGQE